MEAEVVRFQGSLRFIFTLQLAIVFGLSEVMPIASWRAQGRWFNPGSVHIDGVWHPNTL